MTSRLKHKLELEQINVKSPYLNESFVQASLTATRSVWKEALTLRQIGTPLPALANTKKDQLEYVPEWQQEVSSISLCCHPQAFLPADWTARMLTFAGEGRAGSEALPWCLHRRLVSRLLRESDGRPYRCSVLTCRELGRLEGR